MAETSASKLSKRIHTDGSTHYKSATAPASAVQGDLWYDTSADSLKVYDGTSWEKVSAAVPVLSSVTGTIYAGITSDLTLAGSNFLTSNLVVNFVQSSDAIDVDVTVTPSSDSAATVTVPSSVYNSVTAGNVVTIKVTNSDNAVSGTQNKTAVGLPTGGTITSTGGYRYHTFTTSSSLVVPSGFTATADYLVVGGGGGGGKLDGGGGGAGGYRASTYSLSANTYTVTIGAAGTGSTSTARGTDGGSSVFDTITSAGGGGGGSHTGTESGASGGSGGGASHNNVAASGGAGTAGQGFAGGTGYAGGGGGNAGGGGGGAAEAGNTDGRSEGGDGLDWQSLGTYYAGGGGGGQESVGGYSGGIGGDGGGGHGGSDNGGSNLTAGTANTGGGGGGGGYDSGAGGNGANGGSGIVIIRYPNPS